MSTLPQCPLVILPRLPHILCQLNMHSYSLSMRLQIIIFITVPLSLASLSEKSKENLHDSIDLKQVIIIVDNYTEATSKSHFGLTVSLAADPNSNTSQTTGWIFIGAPKSNFHINTTKYNEPGIVWRCKLGDDQTNQDGICKILPITQELCMEKDTKDDIRFCSKSFLGGSMTSSRDSLIACAPTWTKNREDIKKSVFNRVEGSCFWLSNIAAADINSVNVTKLEPFEGGKGSFPFNKGVDFSNIICGNRSRWFYGEAGFSSHIINSGEVVIGTPGVVGWKGGAFLFNPVNHKKYVLTPEYYNEIEKFEPEFEYFGYAVTSGKYLDSSTVLIAASSPNANTNQTEPKYLTGSVFLVASSQFHALKDRDKLLSTKNHSMTWYSNLVIRGEQFGSYFGAALESINMDADELDELLVGAPFYQSPDASDGDNGCVYAYGVLKGNGEFDKNPLRIVGKIAGSRFGSSIAKLGDINQDGYDDVAIGAPYENMRGAVYVYYGGEAGINEKNYLRIDPGQYIQNSVDFFGFGYSISAGVDIDRNGIPDFAIGSYMNKSSVIFRMRPKLTIHSAATFHSNNQFETPVKILPRQTSAFQIKLCLSIQISTTLERTNNTTIWALVEVDGRFNLTSDLVNTTPGSIIVVPINIPSGENSSCEIIRAQRFPKTGESISDDEEADVDVQQKYWYNDTTEVSPNLSFYEITQQNNTKSVTKVKMAKFSDFCATCAYNTSMKPEKISIMFELDCTNNITSGEVCKPDLQLNIVGIFDSKGTNIFTPENNQTLSFGGSPWITLNLTVTNKDQTAINPRIKLQWKWNITKEPYYSTKTALPTLDSPQNCNITSNLDGRIMEADCPIGAKKRLKTNVTRSLNYVFSMKHVIAMDPNGLALEFETSVYSEDGTKNNDSFQLNYRTNDVNVKISPGNKNIPHTLTGLAADQYFVFKCQFGGVTPVNSTMRFLIPTHVRLNGMFEKVLSVETPVTKVMTFIPLNPQYKINNVIISFVRTSSIPHRQCLMYLLTVATDGSCISLRNIDPKSLHSNQEINEMLGNIKNEILKEKNKSGQERLTDFVNCMDQTSHAHCAKFECKLSASIESDRVFDIAIKVSMNSTTAEKLILEKEEPTIVLAAYGDMKIFDGTSSNYHSETLSIITFKLNKYVIPAWIYMASAGGGLIVLIFIILALCRYGFFTRDTKTKLEQLKVQAEVEDANRAIQIRYQDQSPSNVVLSPSEMNVITNIEN